MKSKKKVKQNIKSKSKFSTMIKENSEGRFKATNSKYFRKEFQGNS